MRAAFRLGEVREGTRVAVAALGLGLLAGRLLGPPPERVRTRLGRRRRAGRWRGTHDGCPRGSERERRRGASKLVYALGGEWSPSQAEEEEPRRGASEKKRKGKTPRRPPGRTLASSAFHQHPHLPAFSASTHKLSSLPSLATSTYGPRTLPPHAFPIGRNGVAAAGDAAHTPLQPPRGIRALNHPCAHVLPRVSPPPFSSSSPLPYPARLSSFHCPFHASRLASSPVLREGGAGYDANLKISISPKSRRLTDARKTGDGLPQRRSDVSPCGVTDGTSKKASG